MVNRKRKQHQFTITDNTNLLLTEYAKQLNTNRSRLIDEAVKYYIDQLQINQTIKG